MKKLFTIAATLLIAVASMGQTPVITFDKTTHDFGKINEADGRVTTVFTFKNEGMSPLVLSNVRASCGCTTPKWTREPIEPGQIGEITVTYNPNGRPGRFQKTVTVTRFRNFWIMIRNPNFAVRRSNSTVRRKTTYQLLLIC